MWKNNSESNLKMQYDIDHITILNAAVKTYGAGTQISNICYIDTLGEYISLYVTPPANRSFKGRFFYKKRSFDAKEPDIAIL